VSEERLDTIVAPATPVGRSALAMVRIDGPRSGAILEALSGTVPDERHAALVRLTHDGEVIDECVAIRYAAPRSFTGNDLVELTLHGNPLLMQRVIEAAVIRGARLAQPGEFTERAVLNGKLDLVQAESIADLINARTSLQARLSIENLEGTLSRTATEMRESLLRVISRLEAALDFSEEGYEFISRQEARAELQRTADRAAELGDTYRRGRATVEGLSAVILGRPNVGKSTLLNRLVGSDRAIVTPIPGTTRDIVRETIEIGGLPVTLADTAGLRQGADVVEGIGIERARDAARRAELVLYLVDATTGLTDEDAREMGGIDRPLVIYTKADLAAAPADSIGISGLTGEGIPELLGRLDAVVREQFAADDHAATIVNERQRMAVSECRDALRIAIESLDGGADEPIVLVDLYRAASALGLLVGAITREDVLGEIFAKFCIGK
jgi:tRNA modification GTPase